MPAKRGLQGGEEGRRAASAQQPTRRSQEHSVGLLETRTSHLTAKNRQLVSKHHDLELFELTRAQPEPRPPKRPSEQQVQQRYDQAPTSLHETETNPSHGAKRACAPQQQMDLRPPRPHIA